MSRQNQRLQLYLPSWFYWKKVRREHRRLPGFSMCKRQVELFFPYGSLPSFTRENLGEKTKSLRAQYRRGMVPRTVNNSGMIVLVCDPPLCSGLSLPRVTLNTAQNHTTVSISLHYCHTFRVDVTALGPLLLFLFFRTCPFNSAI